MSSSVETTSREFGIGSVILSTKSGAITQFVDSGNTKRKFLLDPKTNPWHSPAEHNWGSGYVITDHGSGRWSVNNPLPESNIDGSTIGFRPIPRLSLQVVREFGSSLTERYIFTNNADIPLTITSLGIQTPFSDIYNDAESSLSEAVHAHIFTGGAWSWVLAQPMSGEGQLLGLTVQQGQLWGYSIESRNQWSNSNIRGHIVLQITDFARNPEAFGGQTHIKLLPEESYCLEWKVGWFSSVPEFIASTNPPAEFSSFSSSIKSSITIRNAVTEPISRSPSLKVTPHGNDFELIATSHGSFSVDIGNSRTEVNFHLPLQDLVQRRCEYILRFQQSVEREGLCSHAFVPVHTGTLLTQTTNGWSDWTDGSERIAMPVLLQLAAMRGWIDSSSTDSVLESWSLFAQKHLMDENCVTRRGSQDNWSEPRLYDAPWLAQFFNDRYRWHWKPEDLDIAVKIIEKAFSLGMRGFLAIHLSETVLEVIKSLDLAGWKEKKNKLSDLLVGCATYFVEAGRVLPKHEVNYEQSIVAPLANLFMDAYTLTKRDIFLSKLEEILPWLLAFGGPQPHARLAGVPIRHWDGYWFGSERIWGDVFPHYWSTLTSTVLLRMPKKFRSKQTDALAEAILRANMANYRSDGSATCAFVMPSTVDGRSAHSADPLANDQDWHLVAWLRLIDEGALQND